MKRIKQIISIVMTMAMLLGSQGITAAFADSVTDSFQSSNFQNASSRITLWQRYPFFFTMTKENVTLVSTASSDPTVVGTEIEKTDDPYKYIVYASGYKNGKSTVTVTASDGSTMTSDIIVEGNAPYTISSDTTQDFSIPKNGSYIMKVHFVNNIPQSSKIPSVVSDNKNVVATQIMDYSPTKSNDYFFRIDALGNVGENATLYIGGFGDIMNRLCKVTVRANKDLKLDTTTQYNCDVGTTYKFIAYTSSATVPAVSANSGAVTTKYAGKVAGGYLFSVTSLFPGDALIRVTSNGEYASFLVSVRMQSLTSDTPRSITLDSGKSYTYKIKVTGSKDPTFTAEFPNLLAVTLVKKEGGYFYVKVTAKGNAQASSALIANFPNQTQIPYPVYVGYVLIPDPHASTAPAPKSDTTTAVTIAKGTSYTYKITNATLYLSFTSNFTTELIRSDGYDKYYKITATGNIGGTSGVNILYDGQLHPISSVAVGSYPPVKSDTTSDFNIAPGGSYTFKITTANPQIEFYTDNSALFTTSIVKHVGNDYYCKITAKNISGKSAAFFVNIPGDIHPVVTRLCSVSIK